MDIDSPKNYSADVSVWPMWILGFVIMIDSVDQNIVRGVIPQIQHTFHVGDFAIGLLISSFILVNGILTIPAGYLADRLHRVHTIGNTVVAWSLISASTATAPTFSILVTIRSLLGFGQAVTGPATNSLLADYYTTERRGKAFSVQQSLSYIGFAIGVALGGNIAVHFGWRWAFLIVSIPGTLLAIVVWRLKEPQRGSSDISRVKLRMKAVIDPKVVSQQKTPDVPPKLLSGGLWIFIVNLLRGLKRDLRTIFAVHTLRYALVGAASILFTIGAIGTWLPEFYIEQLHVSQSSADSYFSLLVIVGGIPGVLLGGLVADFMEHRIRGARVVIPGYCMIVATTLAVVSFMDLSFWPTYILQLVALFFITLSVPSLYAGFSDVLPANLRGTGFAAFNLVSLLLGTASGPVVLSFFAQLYGGDLRTAFLIVMPPVYIGAFLLLRSRNYLEKDSSRIFEAIIESVETAEDNPELGSGVSNRDISGETVETAEDTDFESGQQKK